MTGKEVTCMNKEFGYPRDFKGVWIPKEVFLDDRLNAIEKIILVEVDSLDVEGSEGCYASNEYLAKFCQCSVTKVSTSISKLIKLGYLYVSGNDGRKRYLKSRLSNFERQDFRKSDPDSQNMKQSNNSDKYSLDDMGKNKDFIQGNKESKTSNSSELEGSIPSPNKKKKALKYRDEDLLTMLKGKLSSAFFGNFIECEYTNTHYCLAVSVTKRFFKEYEKFFGEQHEMITEEYAKTILDEITIVSSEMEEIGIDSTDQYDYYYAMIDEFFKSDYGKNSKKKYDKKIYLFFSDGNQAILFARIKDKFQSEPY